MGYDFDRKRPLEIALLLHDLEKGEGRSERELTPRKRIGADAFLLMRALAEEDGFAMGIHSSDASGRPLDLPSIFRMWVSLTGFVSREAGRTKDAKTQRFLQMVLHQLGLREDMKEMVDPTGDTDPAPAQDATASSE